MVNRRTNYTEEAVAAARSVLLELAHALGEYQEDIVVVGGWVPELLLPQDYARHVGSIDVDLALNHQTLQELGYKTIAALLLERGYEMGKQPFIFHRKVKISDHEYHVEVDFLAGEYGGTGKGRRTQKVQDLQPRKARGVDLAFVDPVEIPIRGRLPDGGEDMVTVRVAAIAPFIVMKGMALTSRLKEKDAWDIYYCVRYYPDGPDGLIAAFQPYLEHGLVQEGLKYIAEKFSSPKAVGPAHVADFEEESDPDARQLLQRDAFERLQSLLRGLGI